MSASLQDLLIDKKSWLVTITLNRPEVHNALNLSILQGLAKSFGSLKKDKELRAVVLRGNGPSFCAGGDLNWMRDTVGANRKQVLRDSKFLADAYAAIFNCPVPVIARIHGNVLAGGLGLVAASDIVIADDDARFCFSEVRLGLVPSVISPYVLNKAGEGATPYLLTAENFDVVRAAAIGIVQFYGNATATNAHLEKTIKQISDAGPEAVRITKKLIRDQLSLSWVRRQALSLQVNAERRSSAEGQEGMQAFLEKRQPNWRNN